MIMITHHLRGGMVLPFDLGKLVHCFREGNELRFIDPQKT